MLREHLAFLQYLAFIMGCTCLPPPLLWRVCRGILLSVLVDSLYGFMFCSASPVSPFYLSFLLIFLVSIYNNVLYAYFNAYIIILILIHHHGPLLPAFGDPHSASKL